MPPKAKITKKEIARNALALIRRKGIRSLTAKALAAEMKCSTQPIFWYYRGMDDLKQDVYREALALFDNYLRIRHEGISEYNSIGINYIRFAGEEKECFKWLFMSGEFRTGEALSNHSEAAYVLDVLEKTENLTGEEARSVFEEMWMFVHGIATMIASDTADFGDEKIRKMLSDVYRGLIKNLSDARSR